MADENGNPSQEPLPQKKLETIVRRHNAGLAQDAQRHSKKRLFPYVLRTKENHPDRWASWCVDAALEARLIKTLQVKPRRTASGVATITVITKPWKCSSDCLYCPNDLRMPKSYLSNEPACQRAERNYFDPYLQVTSRLRALTQMGHNTDKVEVIVLGGTWCDYAPAYQIWFTKELFRALNDGAAAESKCAAIRTQYANAGISNDPDVLASQALPLQEALSSCKTTYNKAWSARYEHDPAWLAAADFQTASFAELQEQQRMNESARHRMVGFVVETRPDTVNTQSLALLRSLGCTKIQMGIQTLDQRVAHMNRRTVSDQTLRQAFDLARLFGFKLHTHFMVNLYGQTPESDKADYARFMTDAAFQPDEVKVYPCVLVEGAQLCTYHDQGKWTPYTEEELLDILVEDTLATPGFTRISRMIRDISACDIVAGNKKANLRQMVELAAEKQGRAIQEIRYREISTQGATIESLTLKPLKYTTSNSHEYFLQWVTPENKIAGFLRLSLPNQDFVTRTREAWSGKESFPIGLGEAMIREVHVYGVVAGITGSASAPSKTSGAQHLGLGKRLIAEACRIARTEGYSALNVISSVGTREYYRAQGFTDKGLYQQISLLNEPDQSPSE